MRLQLAIAAVLLSSPVLAADLVEMAPAPPPPVVAANPFNGFYAGVHVGYVWGNISGTGSTPLLQEVPAVSVVAVDVQQQILGGFPFDYDQNG